MKIPLCCSKTKGAVFGTSWAMDVSQGQTTEFSMLVKDRDTPEFHVTMFPKYSFRLFLRAADCTPSGGLPQPDALVRAQPPLGARGEPPGCWHRLGRQPPLAIPVSCTYGETWVCVCVCVYPCVRVYLCVHVCVYVRVRACVYSQNFLVAVSFSHLFLYWLEKACIFSPCHPLVVGKQHLEVPLEEVESNPLNARFSDGSLEAQNNIPASGYVARMTQCSVVWLSPCRGDTWTQVSPEAHTSK